MIEDEVLIVLVISIGALIVFVGDNVAKTVDLLEEIRRELAEHRKLLGQSSERT